MNDKSLSRINIVSDNWIEKAVSEFLESVFELEQILYEGVDD